MNPPLGLLFLKGKYVHFKDLGTISIALTWAGLLFMIHKWRGDKSMSYSGHAARYTTAKIYYFVLFIITLPIFYIFVDKWFVPELGLSKYFLYLTVLAIIGQLISVSVPSIKGRKETIHNIGAFIIHTSLIGLTAYLLASSHVPAIARGVTAVALAFMVSIWVLFIFTTRLKTRGLIYQSLFVACFHITILAAAYLR
jgi:hypothetical protein